MAGEGEYLFDSVRDLCLVADVTRVKWSVMIALNDVKNGHRVTTGEQSLYDVAAEETAAADDEEGVAGHDTMANGLTRSFLFLTRSREHPLITRNRSVRTAAIHVLSRAEAPAPRKLGHRRYRSLLLLRSHLISRQSPTAPTNSSHGSPILSQRSATATNAS